MSDPYDGGPESRTNSSVATPRAADPSLHREAARMSCVRGQPQRSTGQHQHACVGGASSRPLEQPPAGGMPWEVPTGPMRAVGRVQPQHPLTSTARCTPELHALRAIMCPHMPADRTTALENGRSAIGCCCQQASVAAAKVQSTTRSPGQCRAGLGPAARTTRSEREGCWRDAPPGIP